MESVPFHDGNIHDLIESRYLDVRQDVNYRLQMHSSLAQWLSQETELEKGGKSCSVSAAAGRVSELLSGFRAEEEEEEMDLELR